MNHSNERTIASVDFPVACGTREGRPNREAVSQHDAEATACPEVVSGVASLRAAVVVVRHSRWPPQCPSVMHRPRGAGVAAFDSPWDRGCLP